MDSNLIVATEIFLIILHIDFLTNVYFAFTVNSAVMNICSPNSCWVSSVSFVCVSFKLSEFWPIICKMLSVEVVRRAAHEYILLFLHTQAKFCFLSPFCAFK